MNIALTSKMFIGNVVGTNMGKVAEEEHLIMNELRRLIAQPKAA